MKVKHWYTLRYSKANSECNTHTTEVEVAVDVDPAQEECFQTEVFDKVVKENAPKDWFRCEIIDGLGFNGRYRIVNTFYKV